MVIHVLACIYTLILDRELSRDGFGLFNSYHSLLSGTLVLGSFAD